jgi:prepilin-type N-terminal cleavage/methylation domain-containing protein/prepilin-type processing-associated H-X9-DG protein
MLPRAQRRSGFTLIELLVVIAVIAILAGIIFPVFAQARKAARKATCQSNLMQVTKALLMYVQDYDERMHWFFNCLDKDPINWHRSYWWYCLYPYTKNWKVFQCPSVPGGTNPFGQPPDPDIPEGGMSPWVDFRGYGINVAHIAGCEGATRSLAELGEPARTIAYGDSAAQHQGEIGRDCGPMAWQSIHCGVGPHPDCWILDLFTNWPGCPVSTKWAVGDWHQGGANFGFADGHVKWYKRDWNLATGGGGAIYEKDPAQEIWGHFTTSSTQSRPGGCF